LRLDRYFSSDEDEVRADSLAENKKEYSYAKLEVPSDNPSVVHIPMMCQHCNHAPCETVCPVAATTHSNEGLNQMTYNRCIGTRYCANNCPYKVRRFNWFNYPTNSRFQHFNPSQFDMGRMVLNPDVTVRSRGVMEKCSMCVQQIQSGKLTAKREGRVIADGEIQSACSSSCPTDAITFGDINDKGSKIRKESEGDRAYHILEEIGTQPNIYYQVKVRNTNEA
ncbi:4Fe-4S dicluster domain-containing protein, partial [Flavobacteriales bacterium]|nr:4Fe-4S dicluster domain-containing protein [Flavobacteriales bacterium]